MTDESVEIPKQTDIGWSDYVVGLLDPDEEVRNGLPLVNGLRRLTLLLMGEYSSTSDILQAPLQVDNFRATVRHTIEFTNGFRYDGCADVSVDNKGDMFGQHPVATAETIAEGRALKRALKIQCSAYEELEMAQQAESSSTVFVDSLDDSSINSGQVIAINQLAKRLDIDVEKLIENVQMKMATKEDATAMLGVLNQFQQEKLVIPESVKGYTTLWEIKK